MTRRLALALLHAVASRGLVLALLLGWATWYVTAAVWTEEAFEDFVVALGGSRLVQAAAALFLLCSLASLARGIRARFAAGWPWLPLPVGLWLFALGFVASAALREQHWVKVAVGHEVRAPRDPFPWTVEAIDSPLVEVVREGAPHSKVFEYEPSAVLVSGPLRVRVGVFPPVRLGRSLANIMDFGLAPRVRIEHMNRVLQQGPVVVDLLPPGTSDELTLDGMPYRFEMRIVPGEGGTISFDKPVYEVAVWDGERSAGQGLSSAPIEFDGLTLTFGAPESWVWIQVVRDPGRPFVLSGLLAMALGIAGAAALAIARTYRAVRALRGK